MAAHQLVHLSKLELALQRELDQHIPPATAATSSAGQGERASARAYRCQPCGGQPRPAGCPEPALRQGWRQQQAGAAQQLSHRAGLPCSKEGGGSGNGGGGCRRAQL